MTFRPYMHIEKFGNTAVEGIELGKAYVFPKLDGTNASTWLNEENVICAGSRTRTLSENSDNAGFFEWAWQEMSLARFHGENKNLRLYGEWLVPHTFKGYRPEAWRNFYVFDVFNDETEQYLSYDVYSQLLEKYNIAYIPPLAIIQNASEDNFKWFLDQNKYLCPDDGSPGEGVVIKNYDFYNKFGQQVWAKIIRQEFKDTHNRVMGAPEINNSVLNESRIVEKALTKSLIEKTIAKISEQKDGWSSKCIPELFGRLYYDIIKEELFDCLKEINFGTVNFKTLKAIMINKVKELKPDIF